MDINLDDESQKASTTGAAAAAAASRRLSARIAEKQTAEQQESKQRDTDAAVFGEEQSPEIQAFTMKVITEFDKVIKEVLSNPTSSGDFTVTSRTVRDLIDFFCERPGIPESQKEKEKEFHRRKWIEFLDREELGAHVGGQRLKALQAIREAGLKRLDVLLSSTSSEGRLLEND